MFRFFLILVLISFFPLQSVFSKDNEDHVDSIEVLIQKSEKVGYQEAEVYLLEAINRGSTKAASLLLTWGLWEATRNFKPFAESVVLWKNNDKEIDGMPLSAVYAVLVSNWAAREENDLKKKKLYMDEATQTLKKHADKHPILLSEYYWLLSEQDIPENKKESERISPTLVLLFKSYESKAVGRNKVAAQSYLGQCYSEGVGVVVDYKKSFEWYMKAADKGYYFAQYNVAQCYMYGEGVGCDEEKAIEFYIKAAEQGDSYAQAALGDCYLYGEGVVENFKMAIKWYKKSAGAGNEIGMHSLGLCYLNGEGVKKNVETAISWITKASIKGDAYAQYDLGDIYYGLKDYKNAVMWFCKSAAQEDMYAEYMLGKCHLDGTGINMDRKAALFLINKSAKQGNVEAIMWLRDNK